jgi:hypothetical protein
MLRSYPVYTIRIRISEQIYALGRSGWRVLRYHYNNYEEYNLCHRVFLYKFTDVSEEMCFLHLSGWSVNRQQETIALTGLEYATPTDTSWFPQANSTTVP